MKRVIVTILLILLVQTAGFAVGHKSAKSSPNPNLSSIETTIFGYDNPNENETKRIERIEEYLYGAKKSGSNSRRLENIQNDMGYITAEEQAQQKVEQERQQQIKAQKEEKKAREREVLTVKEDETVDYPIVDKMEQELFKTNYKNENIYARLNRLEKQVFNQTSDATLNERVDKLSSVIHPSKNSRNNQLANKNYNSDDLDKYYRESGLEPVSDNSIPFQLAVLEQDLLNNEYSNDNTAIRLNRLEQKLFKRSFATDTDITRLQRIMVAYDAKKNSYKYENNRKMQNLAAATQLGGILLMILAILL